MNGLELLGGVVVFLCAFILFPRTFFTICLAIVMVEVWDINIFATYTSSLPTGTPQVWSMLATVFLILMGILGIFADISEHRAAWWG